MTARGEDASAGAVRAVGQALLGATRSTVTDTRRRQEHRAPGHWTSGIPTTRAR